MNKKSTMILLSSVVILVLIVGGIGIVMANNSEDYIPNNLEGEGFHLFQRHRRFLFRISEDKCDELALKFESIKPELQALKSEVKALMDAGASQEDIRALISTKLEELGIEAPKCDDAKFLLSSLTDEQKDALRLRVQEMKEDEASREEIRAELTKMLQDWDIEVPEYPSPLRQRLRNRRHQRIKTGNEP